MLSFFFCSHGVDKLSLALKYGTETWIADDQRTACRQCSVKFSFICRRSHCKTCGDVFCGECVDMRVHRVTKKAEKQCLRCCQMEDNTLKAVPIAAESRIKAQMKSHLHDMKQNWQSYKQAAADLREEQQLCAARGISNWRKATSVWKISCWTSRYGGVKLDKLMSRIVVAAQHYQRALILNWRCGLYDYRWQKALANKSPRRKSVELCSYLNHVGATDEKCNEEQIACNDKFWQFDALRQKQTPAVRYPRRRI